METWSSTAIASQSGKLAVIFSGAKRPLAHGDTLEDVARRLASHGANVLIASPLPSVPNQMQNCQPCSHIERVYLDSGDFASIKKFADNLAVDHHVIDILIRFGRNKEGPNEAPAQIFQQDYLAWFNLVARLAPLLFSNRQARVIMVNSLSLSQINRLAAFNPLHPENLLSRSGSYLNTKPPPQGFLEAELATAMFAQELRRQSEALHSHLCCRLVTQDFARINTRIISPLFSRRKKAPGPTPLVSRILYAATSFQTLADSPTEPLFTDGDCERLWQWSETRGQVAFPRTILQTSEITSGRPSRFAAKPQPYPN